jgi:DNA-binding response OmpR family regulator
MQTQTVWRGSISVTNKRAYQAAAPVILVVTGDRSLREASERALSREGYTVITAAHAGHAVLACLKAGRVDLLAVELSMEDTSGPALATRLRRHFPEMGTVYFANAGTRECEGVLVRPFTRDDLLGALRLARTGMSVAPTSAS